MTTDTTGVAATPPRPAGAPDIPTAEPDWVNDGQWVTRDEGVVLSPLKIDTFKRRVKDAIVDGRLRAHYAGPKNSLYCYLPDLIQLNLFHDDVLPAGMAGHDAAKLVRTAEENRKLEIELARVSAQLEAKTERLDELKVELKAKDDLVRKLTGIVETISSRRPAVEVR
jgi:hypothetical protein